MAAPANSSAQTNCQPLAPDELELELLLLDEVELLLDELLLDELLLEDVLEDELLLALVLAGLSPPQAVSMQHKNSSEVRNTGGLSARLEKINPAHAGVSIEVLIGLGF